MAPSLTRSNAADLTDMTMGCQEPSLVAAADILVLRPFEVKLVDQRPKQVTTLLPTSSLVN